MTKRSLIILIISLIVAGGITVYAFFALPQPKNQMYAATAAQVANLDQTVSADGTVTASTEVDLGFQRDGQISAINVAIGNTVQKGQILAQLDESSLDAQLQAAQASLNMAQIALAKLTAATTTVSGTGGVLPGSGNSGSEIQTSISNAEQALEDKTSDAWNTVDSVLSADIDQLFSSPQTNPVFSVTITDASGNRYSIMASPTEAVTVNAERAQIGNLLKQWATLNQAASVQNQNTLQNLTQAETLGETTLTAMQTFLTNLAAILETYSPINTSAQAVYATYTGAIASGRDTVNTALSALRSANETFQSAQAPTNVYDVASQQAAVATAAANLAAVNAQISQSVITAPVDGIITEQNGNVGETVSANTSIIHLISSTPYQITAYVSEDTVAGIESGQAAEVTLEAYGTDTLFPATVISVDPGQTVINNVPMYKVTLQFDQSDSRIKDGMSATANIIVAEKSGVVVIPASALLNNNGATSVLLISASGKNGSETTEQQPVTTGITGIMASSSSSWVEIVSGLQAGQNVATFGTGN